MTPEERGDAIFTAAIIDGPLFGFARLDPRLVFAQAMHETGNFDSDLVKRANNAFGMKHPSVRPTTSIGPNDNGYATYNSLKDSVDDYFLRQKDFGVSDTTDAAQYIAETVATGYAEDPAYAAKWTEIYSALPALEFPGGGENTFASALPLLLIGVAFLIPWKRLA